MTIALYFDDGGRLCSQREKMAFSRLCRANPLGLPHFAGSVSLSRLRKLSILCLPS
jgi:hypothetical protein